MKIKRIVYSIKTKKIFSLNLIANSNSMKKDNVQFGTKFQETMDFFIN